jgi:sarcosine oxidase
MADVEIAVVGAGIMGLTTAWHLTQRGRQVVVLERFAIGHDRGSSHGSTRIFRFAYDDPIYVRMAQRSLPMWREIESDSGRQLLRTTGGLDTGSHVEGVAAALSEAGATYEWLDQSDASSRFPDVEPGDGRLLYSPNTGVLAAADAVAALAAKADVWERTAAVGVIPERDGVVIQSGRGGLWAKRVVIAAGGWTGPIAAGAGIPLPLQVSREQVFYFAGGDDIPVVIDRGDFFRYLLPPFAGAPGAKAGEHGTGERTSADGRSREIDPEGAARVRDWVGRTVPSLDADPVAAETCLYTNTPDENFIIDVRGPVIICSPCSGHGFKFAPLIGQICAALALGEEPPVDIDRFAISRF